MKKWNKLLALLLAMIMAFGTTVVAFAEGEDAAAEGQPTATEETKTDAETPAEGETAAPAEGETPAEGEEPSASETPAFNGAIVILHTNDVHGATENYAKVAALKAKYEAEGAYVLLMDASDFSQGAPSVNVSQGASAIELMNMAGYDVAAPGNHEFDYGYENLTKLAGAAEFPILAANITYEGKLAFGDNVTFEAPDGTKIGVFGLDTPETASKANPAKIKGVSFAGGEEMYKIAQAQVDALKAAGCTYVIALGHLGIDKETAATANRSIDLLEKVTGISVFIDGHSHSELAAIAEATSENRTVGETVLTSTGTKIANVGVVTIKDGVITTECVAADTIEVAEGDAIAARAAAIQAEIDADYGTVFAASEVELNGAKAPGNRTQETNLGDLITDALVWKATQEGEAVDGAITNGGGIRAAIAVGDITKKDVNTVLPFGNTLNIIKIKGSELLEVLEASTFCTPDAIGGFPQVSGIEFTIDTTKAYDQGEAYGSTTYFAPKTINRVTIAKVGGKDFDPEATYTIATNDFMAAGGDTYFAFTTATANYDLGFPMDEVVMEYITTVLEGKVTAEQYGEPAGRITVKVADTTVATRGELAVALYELAGSPEVTGEAPFSDVAADAACASAVIWASQNEVIKGYPDGTFQPDASLTRQDMATILFRYAKAEAVECDLSAYTDAASIGAYAGEAVQWAVSKKLMTGTAETTFAPLGTLTRDQVITILERFAEAAAEAPVQEAETEAPAETETPVETETKAA